VQKLDDTHVRFVYSASFPEVLLLQALVHFQIVPQKYVQQSAKTGLWPSRSAAGRSRTRGAP